MNEEIINITSAISPISGSLLKLIAKTQKVSDEGGVNEIRDQAERQELTLRMAEAQAKVAQELAIARRIETAEEVEIDEYYDYSGEAHAGAKTDGSSLSLGIGAAGKRISKRVYRFKGKSFAEMNQVINSIEETKLVADSTESSE